MGLEIPFMKMHGLGNDFLVFDTRDQKIDITPNMTRKLADRNRSVGFDQLAVIGNSNEAAFSLSFFNADGTGSNACCNATRCIASWWMERNQSHEVTMKTAGGILSAVDRGNGLTSVNMGQPRLGWADIPLTTPMDTLELPIEGGPVGTSMGNPHCTFFVDDVDQIELEDFGPMIEKHELFPDRTNVQIAHIVEKNKIRMRVWERGTGLTLASGSSSCAVAVAAIRRELTDSTVDLVLDGGEASVTWDENGVWMTAETAFPFHGYFNAEYWEHLAKS